ncbi:MAG: putative Ig domain-containing protein [Betaproteobacteria bacterium]
MNIQNLKIVLASALLSICTFSSVQAQTAVSINGTVCAGATIVFGAGGINVNAAANCVGTTGQVPSINNSTPANADQGAFYSHSFSANGSTPLSWAVTSGALPAGMGINATTGVVSGTPTTIQTYSFSVTASNTFGTSAPLSTSINVVAPSGPPVFGNSPPTTASIGTAYSHQYTATGAAPIAYSIVSGVPPSGITLSPTGLLAGAPLAGAVTSAFTVQASNSVSTTTQAVNIAIIALVGPTITSFAPPAGTVNAAYTYTFAASGSAPITWDKATGTLPPGLTISAAGVLSGTPTTAGTYTFTARATNSVTNAVSANISITISPPISSGGFGSADINGNPIPAPVSRVAKAILAPHAGPNGGGGQGGLDANTINAWSVDPTVCSNATPGISTLWYHNVSLLDYGSQSAIEYFDFQPNQAITYAFMSPQPTTTQEAANGQVGRLFITQGPSGTPASSFVSVSTSPCDFDVTKIASGNKCYATGSNENGFTFQVTGGVGVGTVCKMAPNTKYYLNIRFQDARPAPTGTPTLDACTTQLSTRPGSSTCGVLLQIQTY